MGWGRPQPQFPNYRPLKGGRIDWGRKLGSWGNRSPIVLDNWGRMVIGIELGKVWEFGFVFFMGAAA